MREIGAFEARTLWVPCSTWCRREKQVSSQRHGKPVCPACPRDRRAIAAQPRLLSSASVRARGRGPAGLLVSKSGRTFVMRGAP